MIDEPRDGGGPATDSTRNSTMGATDQFGGLRSPQAAVPTPAATPAGDHAQRTSGVGETVHDTVDRAKDEAGRLADDVKAEGREIGRAAGERAKDFAQTQKEAGADQASSVARAFDKAGDELAESSPIVARYVHEAASAVDSVSQTLRERSLGGLMQDVNDYARREPVVFFGIAIAAGFALSRLVKSSAEHRGDRAGRVDHGLAHRTHSETRDRRSGPSTPPVSTDRTTLTDRPSAPSHHEGTLS